MQRTTIPTLLLPVLLLMSGCGDKPETNSRQTALTDEQMENLVRRSYQYVAMYNVNNKCADDQVKGWNKFQWDSQRKDHTFKVIARPNNDTMYIVAMLDVRKEPVILDIPAFDSDYISLLVSGYDHYVDMPLSTRQGSFKKPEKILFYSSRTEGYDGGPVDGVDKVFECTGDFIQATVRVMPHATDPDRYQRIVKQMDSYQLKTLSEYRGGQAKPIDDVEFPPVGETDADIFENNLLEVMQFVCNHTTFDPNDELDKEILAALEPLGVVPGQAFDPAKAAKLDGVRFRKFVERMAPMELAQVNDPEFVERNLQGLFQPKGQMNLERLLFQSVIGPIGLPVTEAAYPPIVTSDGKPLNAQHDYVIRMSADELPPATAFWSVTLYNTKNGFFIPNDQKKYSVGKNGGMKLNSDGGIEIHIAAEQPEGVPEENWLPLNRDDYDIDAIMRLYVPDLEKMNTWAPPKAERIEPNQPQNEDRTQKGGSITPEEAKKIATEAYIFGSAFVSNYRVYFPLLLSGDPLFQGAGFNEFAHNRQPFPPETRDTTQRDTLFSLSILDLRREPIVISVPDVPRGQSYMLQMGDTSTETLPYISTLTTDNKAGDYVLVGPEFQGNLPADQFDGVILTRGQFVVINGRTIIADPDDMGAEHAIQDGMQMRALSAFLGTEPPPEPPKMDFLPWDAEKAAGAGVFDYINMALAWHPPAMSELDAMARFSRIGVVPGQSFTTEGMSDEIIAALDEAVVETNRRFEEEASQVGAFVGNWQWDTSDISRFGTDYFRRSAQGFKTIYPNAPDHAVYGQAYRDADDQQLSGERGARIRFEKGKLPPADMFWSLTLYDAKTTAMHPNDARRYSIGSTTNDLALADDGSLTLYIQHDEPADPAERANWLPAPKGDIYLVIRLYGAKPEVFAGKWTPPPITKIEQTQ